MKSYWILQLRLFGRCLIAEVSLHCNHRQCIDPDALPVSRSRELALEVGKESLAVLLPSVGLHPTVSPIAHHSSRPEDAQSRLEATSTTIDDRISPFSTPPSSDDSLDADVAGQTAPTTVQHSLIQTQDVNIYKAPRSPSQQVPSKSRETGHPGRQQSPAVDAAFKSHLQPREQRPELPPRPEATPRPPSIKTIHAPMFTSSTFLRDKNESIVPHKLMPARQSNKQHPHRTLQSGLPSSPGFADPRPPARAATSSKAKSSLLLHTDTLPSNAYAPALPEEGHSPQMGVPRGGYTTYESPDGSSPNRRAPYITGGSHVIHTNYDSKIFDVCAGRACSAGQLIRVWDLSSGKMLLSIPLGERDIKATAIAFKPAAKTEEEGARLWVGTNHGNVHEVDVMSHQVVSSGENIHSGHEVVSIHRYQNSMWTLDEDGTLHLWLPGNSGLPTLESKPVTRKLPRGHSFSMVVKGLLWVAIGKEIQVFRPSANDLGEYRITQQPIRQPGVGEITSGAVVGDQLDKLYFSHSDGKVSIYSVANYACLGVVIASVYKINCLVGAGRHLWAGYNTGKICVYDTQTQPWKIVKEWHAHGGPVANLSVDRIGLWVSGLLRVGSVSLDNTIRVWDGFLEEDWFGTSTFMSPGEA